jgi:hypothetical protein
VSNWYCKYQFFRHRFDLDQQVGVVRERFDKSRGFVVAHAVGRPVGADACATGRHARVGSARDLAYG